MRAKQFNPLAGLVMAVALTIGLAGCGGGSTTAPPPDLGPAKMAASDAVDAAKAAADAAAVAVAGVDAIKDADASSHAQAEIAARAAMAAYEDAKAASDSAAEATTLPDAEMYRNAAMAAQAAAEAERDRAMEHAGMVTAAHDAAVEMQALSDARMAAMTAAAAAMKAATDAQAAVDAAAAGQSADAASYQQAVDAAAAAMAASNAAMAASDAAAAATTSADAEAQQTIAETKRDEAMAANLSAMQYAQMVTDAYAMHDATARAAAQMAARDAWRAARAALAGVAGKGSANPGAYQLAQDAVADAKAAYDAALAAGNAMEAMRHQEEAEAANERAMAQVAVVIASYDAPRIESARTAAKSAADDAKVAHDAAVAALAAVESIQGLDQASYDMAMARVAAATVAYGEAKAASDAAEAATLLADAEARQRDAEDALEDANAANIEAMKYATMVQDAEDSALASAKTAAKMVYDAAKAAYDAAAMRVAALEAEDDEGRAKRNDDTDGNYFRAKDALARAETAHDAAMAANAMAQAETLSTDAASHQPAIDEAAGTVDTETDDVDIYAGLVEAAYNAAQAQRNNIEQNRMAEEQRKEDVVAARTAAMQAYMDADAAAEKAETAAREAEGTAAGSPRAVVARQAATAARMAANAAKAAHDAIMDDMTKAEADAEATKAGIQAGTANTQYMTAKVQNDAIQTAHQIAMEQQRMTGVRTATRAADRAAMDARKAATTARTNATNARTAADEANTAYMKAMAARTDSVEAKMQAEAAAAAAMMAETAAEAAEAAAEAAEAAHMGIDADGSAEAAQTAQMTAETKQGEAEMARDTADTQSMTAMMARDDAETSADTHVLMLFRAANGAHVMDLEATMAVDETAVHVASVGAAMATIAEQASGAQAAGTTAVITHPGDTVDNPNTEDDEFSEGMMGITVTVNSIGIVAEFRETRAAMDLNDDGETTGSNEQARTQTARQIANLGDFQGYELWENDNDATTDTDRARAIVFTNKQKGDDSVLAVAGGAARSVSAQTVAAGELSNVRSTGNTITGVTWTPSGEAPLTGTLSCTGDTCNLVLDEDGAVTTVAGYTFTGSRATVEAVTAADATENNNYLAFGLWLEESDDGDTDTFGSFAVGGTDYAVNVANTVTGTAIYSGKAAGAHHRTGDGVNWFNGDALLTANFGDATAAGTISGAISNIRVNGGAAMSAPIYLGQAALSDGGAVFNGAAFMGAATAPGASTHEFDGTWSGSFFGATIDDTDTADVNESITAPLATAGTFGVTKSTGTGDDLVRESFVGAFGANKD